MDPARKVTAAIFFVTADLSELSFQMPKMVFRFRYEHSIYICIIHQV